MMEQIIRRLKKEMVFTISAVLALGSMALVPPDAGYVSYVDGNVLAMLFCLMLVVGGFQRIGVFGWLGEWLVSRVSDTRGLSMVLVFLCFFSSMLITNDVALLTFVPFAVLTLQMTGKEERLIPVVVMQTIAANLGSMLTPVGNPQNLYLYSLAGMGLTEFILYMLPLAGISLGMLLAILAVSPKEMLPRRGPAQGEKLHCGWRGWLYTALFLCCMAAVAKLIPNTVMLAVVCAALLVSDRTAFRHADYFLLATFVCFFVFIGNMQRIESVRMLLEQAVAGRELLTAIGASQIISNVPAAILLSGFTNRYQALLWGTNIGGLGTLIASLASLISYKCYGNVPGAQKGRYLAVFSFWNLLFLIVLTVAAVLLSGMMI